MTDSDSLRKAVESLGGEFELIKELGRGATSVVYQLRDHALDRDLAMKVIRSTLGGDEEAVARLQREARMVAQLLHPNIVKLYGTHRLPDGSLALLMEHVPGRNLKEVLRAEGPLSVARTEQILRDIGSALAYAHRRRIVHRDVKPENIYIDEEVGSARLADFGVARPWDQDARLTLPGASLGTPAYMAPEQIDGKEVDGRTDVYSLGLVGYEMLLGHHPWEGENVFTIIFRQKNEEIPVEALGLHDAPSLTRTLQRALAKDPEARPASAQAFLDALSEEPDGDYPSAEAARTEERDAGSVILPPPVRPGDGKGPPYAEERPREPGSPGAELPDDVDHPDDAKVGEFVASKPPVGLRTRRRWGPILGIVAVILIAGTYGIYLLIPNQAGTADPVRPNLTPSAPVSEPTPDDPPPSSVEENLPGLSLTDGATTIGQVGSTVRLLALARGEGGVPLADTLITFQVDDGEAQLLEPTARTDSAGLFVMDVVLPDSPGVALVLASVVGSENLFNQFPLTARAGPPNQVIPLIGNRQAGTAGEALPEILGIRVVDELGNPLAGTVVRFEVVEGDGAMNPAERLTDDVGRAFSRWTLGGSEGSQEVRATVPGAEEASFTFRATAQPAPEPVPEDPPEEEEANPSDSTAEDSVPDEPPPPPPVVVRGRTFSIGGSNVCHLSGGVAACRGANDRGQRGDPALAGLRAIAAGVSHGCGLEGDGTAWCWGGNESGQLGNGTTADSRSAVSVSTDLGFSTLTAGLSHTCGVGGGGTVYCWGRNVYGQLGDGSRDDHHRPEPVRGNQPFQELVAGWNHTCGLVGGNRAFCWGSNSDGQLGDGFLVDRLQPTPVPGTFEALAAGANHTCGIRTDDVFCWGDNAFGQMGDGTTENRLTPGQVIGIPGPVRAIAAGAVHSCALLTGGTVYCWGQNLHGQLGDGTTENRPSPTRVSGDIQFVTIAAGGGMTCGFSQDGAEYCWGLNQSGQLGDGSRTNRSSPTRVGGE